MGNVFTRPRVPIPLADPDAVPEPIPTDAIPGPVAPVASGAELRSQVLGGRTIPQDYSYNANPDLLARLDADPNTTTPLRYPSGKTAAEAGVQIGSNRNLQRADAVGTKRVHDVWGWHDVPVDAAGNEVGLFSAKVPAFSKADYAASPKAEPPPPPKPEAPDTTPVLTAPGATPAAATPPPAVASSGADLRARLLAAMGGGGGGGGAAKAFDPYAERNKAAQDALEQEFALRNQRYNAAYGAQAEKLQEASAMQRYADDAKARGASQHQEAVGKEEAFMKAAEDAAGDRINPDHYKENRSPMQAGLDLLAGVFGGLAAGARGGGPNRGVDALNAKIAADIDAQKTNHSVKREGVEAQRTAYGMMLDRFHQEDVAANAAHVAELDKWRALGDARAAIDDNLKSQAEWVKTREAILEKRAEYTDAARLAAYKRSLGPDKLALLERALKLEKLGAETEEIRARAGKLNAETGEVTPGGLPPKAQENIFRDPDTGQAYVAPNPEARKKTEEVVERERRIQSLADQYVAQLDHVSAAAKAGHKIGVDSAEMAKANNLYATLSGEIRQANNDGVWKASEKELIENQLPSPGKILNGHTNAVAVARQVKATSEQALQRTLRGQGARPIEEGYARDARGNLHPTARYTGGEAGGEARSGAELRSQVTGRTPGFREAGQ